MRYFIIFRFLKINLTHYFTYLNHQHCEVLTQLSKQYESKGLLASYKKSPQNSE